MSIDLVDKIAELLNQHTITKYKLSQTSGINSGTISQMLKRKRPLTIDAVMRLSTALGFKDDHFFSDYVHYCSLNQEDQLRSWRSIHPFLNICVNRGYVAHIEQVLKNIEANYDKNIWQNLLKVAEECKETADIHVLKWLYNYVIQATSFNRKIIAICYYRLYILSGKESLTSQSEQVIYLKSYINELPEQMYINALLKMTTHFYKVKNWDEMERYADLLIDITERVYKRSFNPSTLDEYDEPLDRTLVKFYGQGYLMKSSANRNKGNLDTAKELIGGYSDLSWFKHEDGESKLEIERFKVFAEGNLYHIELLLGNYHVINAYMEFLEKYQEELLPGIVIILQSANKYSYKINPFVIERAIKLINDFDLITNHHIYYDVSTQQIEFLSLTYELTQYFVRIKQIEVAIDVALNCLDISVQLRNAERFMDLIAMLEEFKESASLKQLQNYELIREGLVTNESSKKYSISNANSYRRLSIYYSSSHTYRKN